MSFASPALAQNTSSTHSTPILQLSYQSEDIQFADWVSLFTLCLAPLIAHIFAGAPQPVFLSQKRPSWHERICQFNPTTILWRYFAITDRRVRAKVWNAADMAASNAYFWTVRGWNGSEEMMRRSRAYCTKVPDHSRATLLSGSSVQTLIVTLQGGQALYTLLSGIKGSRYSGTIAINSIFFPLAVFGLLRLFAAPWLTEDYAYTDIFQTTAISKSNKPAPAEQTPLAEARTLSTMGLLELSDTSSGEYFHAIDSWRGRLIRTLFVMPMFGLFIISLLYMIPINNKTQFTATTFLVVLFYLFFLAASTLIYSFYFIRSPSTTTIIPCIASTWYKVYTYVLLTLMLASIVVAALETRRTPCGRYTTWPSVVDSQICEGLIPVTADATLGPFAIAIRGGAESDNRTVMRKGEFGVVSFEGWCQGKAGVEMVVAFVNSSASVI